MATIFPREEKAEYLFDKILENSQACERLMETFYESVESDGEYSGEVLPPEKFAKALFERKLYLTKYIINSKKSTRKMMM